MMEIVRQTQREGTTSNPEGRPSNDKRWAPPSMGRSIFPDDAVARIFRPTRSVTTSGKARTKVWRLTFRRRSAPFIEPLMGWTGRDDTLAQVELEFPTLESAIRYAERQGLAWVVQSLGGPAERLKRRMVRSARAFSGMALEQLGLEDPRESCGRSTEGATNRNDPPGLPNWASPMDLVRDRTLSLDAQRAILVDWAWTEHLIDQTADKGTPANNRPSAFEASRAGGARARAQGGFGQPASSMRNAACGTAMDPSIVFDGRRVLAKRVRLGAAGGRAPNRASRQLFPEGAAAPVSRALETVHW